MNNTTQQGFQVLEVAVEMVRELAPIVRGLADDRDLARQIKRAASSVPLNIAEGNRRVGRDRVHHFRIAAGSAEEVRVALRVAVAWGDLEAARVSGALALLDRVAAMLYRLAPR